MISSDRAFSVFTSSDWGAQRSSTALSTGGIWIGSTPANRSARASE